MRKPWARPDMFVTIGEVEGLAGNKDATVFWFKPFINLLLFHKIRPEHLVFCLWFGYFDFSVFFGNRNLRPFK